MSIHRMQKGVTRQAIDPTSACSGVTDAGAAVTPDDVIACISGMRRVIDPKLGVVKDVERFGAEFEITFSENFEVFQQGNVEICAQGIV